ncbi:MAG: RNA 3'-terminal phosphate cyclase [Candidatus Aenigmarchaeota archaeon]|nr:RNA 3'-terminal phosphate cyclase [Candidatus Aenigmarchaeota archaeon]
MIKIDGSNSGGQVLRTAIALSALTNYPVKIMNIRKGKIDSKPGLRPQHMTGIEVMKKFCDAEVEGLHEWSTEILFKPSKIDVKSHRIDIGTAGSVTLLLQTLLPVLIFSKKSLSLEIIGGTDVKWSPTIHYTSSVLLPFLKKMGVDVHIEIENYGFYPLGGGNIKIAVNPIKKLECVSLVQRGNVLGINIQSICGNLPAEIAERQNKTAMEILAKKYPKAKFSLVSTSTKSKSHGSSITCIGVCEKSLLGGSALGERGVRAEDVATNAANELIESLQSNNAVDKYMADQLLIFMALAKGKSKITVEKITDHVLTNIDVIERFLPVKFEVEGSKNHEGIISVEGVYFNQ